jgi:hypothetical protein
VLFWCAIGGRARTITPELQFSGQDARMNENVDYYAYFE